MSHRNADFPFGYRLPTDLSTQIQNPPPSVTETTGSPRRRFVVLVLVLGALFGGLAATIPTGEAQAMVKHDCVYNPNWESVTYTADPANCQ